MIKRSCKRRASATSLAVVCAETVESFFPSFFRSFVLFQVAVTDVEETIIEENKTEMGDAE